MNAAFVVRRAVRSVKRRPFVPVALTLAFALLALLAGAARLLTLTATDLLPRLADEVHVIAYLREDMSAARAEALTELCRRIPGVRAARIVSSDEALARLRAEVGPLGASSTLLDGLEDGFLPASIEIALEPSAGLSSRAHELAKRLRRIAGVAEVDAMDDGLARLRSFVGVLRLLGWMLLVIAALSGGAVVLLPVGRDRAARASEAEVLTLLGETERLVRLPAALVGATAAATGGVVGVALLFGGFQGAIAALRSSFGAYLERAPAFLGAGELALGLVTLMAMGFLIGGSSARLPRVRHG